MRKNVQKVWRCFSESKPCRGDSTGSIWTDGKTIYSYRTPILTEGPNRRVYILSPSGSHSMTTGTQIRALFERRFRCADEAGLRKAEAGVIPKPVPCSSYDHALRMVNGEDKALPPRGGAKRKELEARTKAMLAAKMQRLYCDELKGTDDAKHAECLVELDHMLETVATDAPLDQFYGSRRSRRHKRRR